jgi:ankyrin repeat protein
MITTTSNLESAANELAQKLRTQLSSGTDETFLEILQSADPEVLSAAMLVKDNKSYTLLLKAAENACIRSTTSAIIALTDKISVDVLSASLLITSNHGETPLHWSAYSSNLGWAIALIDKVSSDALSAALLIKTDYLGHTPLHLAARNSNSAAFFALIKKASIDALSKALLMQDIEGFTALHRAATNSTSFTALINEVSVDALSKALLAKDNYGFTPLHRAAQNSNSAGLIASINKANEDSIPAIAAILKECDVSSKNILTALLSRCDTVTGLSLLNNDKIAKPLKELLLDSAFDPNLASLHQKFFTNKAAFVILDRIWSRIKGGWELLPQVRLRMQLITVLLAKPAFSLTSDEIDFFRYLKKITADHQDKIETLINQHLANRSLSSRIFSKDDNQDTAYTNLLKTEAAQIPDLVLDEVRELSLKIRKNEILIKIIVQNSHDDYLKQLNDYNHRPKIRVEKLNANYKFVHLTGEVVDYQYHNPKNKAAYTHTKKSSATLLGKDLKTPVFGHRHTSRPLVGYLFNREDCVIKAMFKEDLGTHEHHWLTQTKEEAIQIAKLIAEYNFTDEKEFLNEINTDSSRTNEVLLKVKKEAIVAIVIARKDNNSISIAKERQKETRDRLGLDLPIVFYDSNNGVLELVQEKLGNNAQKLKIN